MDHSPNVREGHQVRVYNLMRKGEDAGWAFYMRNFTTGESTYIENNNFLNQKLKIYNTDEFLYNFLHVIYGLFAVFGAPAIAIKKESFVAFVVAEILALFLLLQARKALNKDMNDFNEQMAEYKRQLDAEPIK